MAVKKRGTIKWYKPHLKFDFITLADGSGDVFLDIAAINESGLKEWALRHEGTAVLLDTEPRAKGPSAINVQLEETL